ncbi:hypothetical protein Tco_0966722 [Tanacetum coccineum]
MSKRRERIKARKEVIRILPLSLPPLSIIHHPFITSMKMMIRMMKVPIMQALLLLLVLLTLCQMMFHKFSQTHLMMIQIWKPSSLAKPKILKRQVQLRDEHKSRLRLIGKGIKNLCKGKRKTTPYLQPTNPFLDDPLDAPLRPSSLLSLQSHPSLDITLSLSPITPLDHMFETQSPPLPPQPPLMGHPIYFNVLNYHGAHCLCFFNNQNLILYLRDEMHFVFSHMEYLLTSAIASPFPPHHETSLIAKATTIKESKDLTSLLLDELIGTLKVHEMIVKKDLKIVKAKGERKSFALKANKESSNEESLTSRSSLRKEVDAETQIILSENVLNHQETRTKKLSSEILGVKAVREMMKRLKKKRVSWLMRLARYILNPLTLLMIILQ